MQLGIVVHTWDPTTWDTEARLGVWSQPGLHGEMFSDDNRKVKAMHLCCHSVGMSVRNIQPYPPGQVCAFLRIPRKPRT